MIITPGLPTRFFGVECTGMYQECTKNEHETMYASHNTVSLVRVRRGASAPLEKIGPQQPLAMLIVKL